MNSNSNIYIESKVVERDQENITKMETTYRATYLLGAAGTSNRRLTVTQLEKDVYYC